MKTQSYQFDIAEPPIDLVGAILEAKKRKARIYPVHSNRASELGHPCLRYLYYLRTAWQEKQPPSPELILKFDMGKAIERLVLEDLREAGREEGFEVIEEQRPFEWKEFKITGKIDGKLLRDRTAYPLEIKGFSTHAFERINRLEDMLRSPYAYMRKYPAQIMLYLLLDNKEQGVMILRDKNDARYKQLWVALDYEYAESLLKKAEAVNKAVEAGEPPERMEYEDSVCSYCDFQHICLPEVKREPLPMPNPAEMQELDEMLSRWWELKPLAREFSELDSALKRKLEGKRLAFGSWYIDGKWVETKRYEIPPEVKAQYVVQSKYWRRKIVKIEG